MSCPYCTLPEIKEREIVRNDFAWAFPTNIPIVPGHTLVAPIRCVATYDDMTDEEKEAIEDLRIRIVAALKELYGVDDFNFAWNQGKIAGQSVPHFHLHILPRKEGDSGVHEYEPRQFLYRPGSREATPEDELQAVAQEIKEHLK